MSTPEFPEGVLEECSICEGTTVTQVDDGDGYMDDVECCRCVNGWVDGASKRPTGALAHSAWDKANPKVLEFDQPRLIGLLS